MAELASRTATGGVIGDTFDGYEIVAIQADGTYVWKEQAITQIGGTVQLMTGDGDERIVPGMFWRGRQVWARDFDRVIAKGSGDYNLISGSECHELVDAKGTYDDHARGARNVIGTSYGGGINSVIRSWSINQNGGDGTNIKLYTGDSLSSNRRYQIVVYFTKP